MITKEPIPVGLPSLAGRAAALACVARVRRAFARLHPPALASLRLFGQLGPPYRDRLLWAAPSFCTVCPDGALDHLRDALRRGRGAGAPSALARGSAPADAAAHHRE